MNAATGKATLSGGAIPAAGSCTVKFDVIAARPNTYLFANADIDVAANTITDDQGVTNNLNQLAVSA